MRKPPAHCDALLTWLRGNLGREALGALTGTDVKALAAASHLIVLYGYTHEPRVLLAFADVVRCMQPSTREFAYHAIAHTMDWDDRATIWFRAGLEPIPVRRCVGERAA